MDRGRGCGPEGDAAGQFQAVYETAMAHARRARAKEKNGFTKEAEDIAHDVILRMWSAASRSHDEGEAMRQLLSDQTASSGIISRWVKRTLIDHARFKKRQKRWAIREQIELDDVHSSCGYGAIDLAAYNEALDDLQRSSKESHQIVELLVGGHTVKGAASKLGIAERTAQEWVKRSYEFLRCRLSP